MFVIPWGLLVVLLEVEGRLVGRAFVVLERLLVLAAEVDDILLFVIALPAAAELALREDSSC